MRKEVRTQSDGHVPAPYDNDLLAFRVRISPQVDLQEVKHSRNEPPVSFVFPSTPIGWLVWAPMPMKIARYPAQTSGEGDVFSDLGVVSYLNTQPLQDPGFIPHDIPGKSVIGDSTAAIPPGSPASRRS